MPRHLLVSVLAVFALNACGVEGAIDDPQLGDSNDPGIADPDDTASANQAVTCSARMSVFPVGASHNIGYDTASCGTGTCR